MVPASVKKPWTVIVCAVLVVALGILSFTRMQTNLLPEFELPLVVVFTTYPGANPEKVEQAVTKPLESALSTTGGVNNITSVSSENTSMIMLEFSYSTNMDGAMIEINNNIELVKGYFDDTVSTPYVLQIDPDMMPVLVASIDMDGMDALELSRFTEDTLIPAFERVEGVAEISGMGIVTERVDITLLPERIDALNVKLLGAIDEELADTLQEILDGYDEIEEGRSTLYSELRKQRQELDDMLQELLENQDTLEENKEQLEDGLDQAKDGLKQIEEGREALQALLREYDNLPQYKAQLAVLNTNLQQLKLAQLASPTDLALQQQIAQLEANKAQLEAAIAAMESFGSKEELIIELDNLTKQYGELAATISQLEAALAQLESAEAQLESGIEQAEAGYDQLDDARDSTLEQLDDAEEQLDDAKEQFDEASDEARRAADLGGRITETMIAQILMAQNFSMPAGYAVEGDESYTVKVGEKFESLKEVEELLLFTIDEGDIGDVYLGDVAKVEMTNNAGVGYTKVNGNDGILLIIQKQSSHSTTEVSADLRDKIDELHSQYDGLHITSLSDQGIYIDIITNSVLQNLLMGGVLAMLVLLLFLRTARPTIIVAVSIPLSLLLAVVLMYFTNISLNLISLAGLALGIGMLVDNSIVVIENIYRLRALGESPIRAAVKGASEVGGAIVASTLTTVCVFLPIVFTEGIAKELFADMGLTIAYSLVASLIVALTLVPATGSMILTREAPKPTRAYEKLLKLYERSLRFTLKHKWGLLIVVIGLFGFSVYLALTSGRAFMPAADSTQIVVNLEVERGVELTQDELRGYQDDIGGYILSIDGVNTVGAMEASGDGSILSMTGGDATMYVLLDEQRELSSDEISAMISSYAADLPLNVSISSGNMDISMLSGSGVSLNVYGDDLDVLHDITTELSAIVSGVPGVDFVESGSGDANAEQRIIVDKEAAMRYQLTVAQVYQQVSERLDQELSATTLTIGGEDYEAVLVQDRMPTRSGLKSIIIKGTDSEGKEVDVPLSEIARIDEAPSSASISRSNNKRLMSLTATIASGYNVSLVSDDIEAAVAGYALPDGYTMEFTGESTMINETLTELINMGLLAMLLIYLIMVAQFQSLLSPFIVMFTIPLAFTGGLLLQWACGFDVSVISALGLLVLLGVIVNNGIVFVDCANSVYSETLERRESLVTTGVRRMRPILMTTMTTVLGLVTLAFGMGTGAELLQPMAVVIIGGLTYGTLLTLYVIPALYDVFVKKPPKVISTD